jgi:hypothetical protein
MGDHDNIERPFVENFVRQCQSMEYSHVRYRNPPPGQGRRQILI